MLIFTKIKRALLCPFNLFGKSFAFLVCNRARCFASRLARCLTFAAAALCSRSLECCIIECFDMFHVIFPPKNILKLKILYMTFICLSSVYAFFFSIRAIALFTICGALMPYASKSSFGLPEHPNLSSTPTVSQSVG